MKEVRIKRKKPIKQKYALLLILLLLFLSFVFYLITRPASLPPPVPVADTSIVLFEATEDELLSFTVRPTGGDPYTIVRHNGAYEVEGYPYYDLNLNLVTDMVDNLLYLIAADTIDLSERSIEDHLNDFGLQNGALEVTARFTSNRQYTLRLGSRIPGDIPFDYGMLLGSPSLYALSITLKEDFSYFLNWLHMLPDINFTPDLLDTVRFEDDHGNLLLRRINDDIWMVEEPFSYPASLDQINKLKESVGKMRFAAFIDLAEKADLAVYGLDSPHMKLTFDLADSTIVSYSPDMQTSAEYSVDAQHLTIEIGDLIEGIGFYCLYDESVYQASDLSMGFMLKADPFEYLSTFPMAVPLNHIDSFSVKSEDELIFNFQVSLVEDVLPNNALARDSFGNILFVFSFADDNGNDIPTEKVTDLYKALTAVRTTGVVNQKYFFPDNRAILEAELRYGFSTRKIRFIPYDALHAAIEIDGTILFYTDLNYINEVKKALSAISSER